jgi:hypothetical protein
LSDTRFKVGERMTELDLDRIMRNRSALAASILLLASAAKADPLPDAIGHQLPLGYVMLEAAQGRLTGGTRDDYVVALHRPSDDPDGPIGDGSAPARPLLLFRAALDGAYALAGRNDDMVMRHDQGGQCDPFDLQRGLAMKGAHVTVQTRLRAAITGRITLRSAETRGAADCYSTAKFTTAGSLTGTTHQMPQPWSQMVRPR